MRSQTQARKLGDRTAPDSKASTTPIIMMSKRARRFMGAGSKAGPRKPATP